jgi:putative glycosyltransferase (TIGR04348 family)
MFHTKPSIVIVTPALADANNGNWQTAQRWGRMLASHYRVRLTDHWDETADKGGSETLMIALHARRSAPSVASWRRQAAARPLVVALTGTDLYSDIQHDAAAQHSIQTADRLVVLNELGALVLPLALRAKTVVCLQSCPPRQTLTKTGRHLRVLMVGHLRAVKSPQTYFDAARHLNGRTDILLDHIGAALEPALGQQAQQLMQDCPHYRWLGPLTHEAARRRIQAAHVLVHPSQLEGGAHVVIEAITSGTAVLASRVDGNVGLLGRDYPGYFAWSDAQGLATRLAQLRDDPAMLRSLQQQNSGRAALFQPAEEQRRLQLLLAQLLS